MDLLAVALLLSLCLGQGSSQYSCSSRPDGECPPCDCRPDCFDLSDEVNCTGKVSIHDVIQPHLIARNVQQELDNAMKFFPSPPLPPFRLCPEKTTTQQQTTTQQLVTTTVQLPTTTQQITTTTTKQVVTTILSSTSSPPSDKSTTTTTTRTTVTATTDKPPTPLTTAPATPVTQTVTSTTNRVITTANPVTPLPQTTTTKSSGTISRWFCAVITQQYYRRCRSYVYRFDEYCDYMVKVLRLCRRLSVVTTQKPTTTTIRTPPTFPITTGDAAAMCTDLTNIVTTWLKYCGYVVD